MATCLVSGTLLAPSGEAVTSAMVFCRVNIPVVSGSSVITPETVFVSTDSSGNWSMTVQQSISVIFTVQYPTLGSVPMRQFNYTANVPATSTASFTDIIVIE